jgi:hypothetical protein
MTVLVWAHAAYLVMLAGLLAGCLWIAQRDDFDGADG